MSEIIYNMPEIAKFVSKNIKGDERFPLDSPCVGIIRGGKIIAGVVYSLYTGNSIAMNVAATAPGWLNKAFLRTVFRYPFEQLGVSRVSALVRTDNETSSKFVEHVGFVREGCIRKAESDGTDLYLYGMLKEECRWLNI